MGLGVLTDGLAPTPPMGWNSWNAFHLSIDERTVLETAEAIVARGLRDAGYRYVVIDDGWEAPERDASGDLVADPATFPHGLRAVADRVHALGLRFGIYTDAGTATCQGLPGSLGYEFRDARRFADWGVDFVKVDWCNTRGCGPRGLYLKWAAALRATGRPIVLSICEWGRSRPWEWAGTVGHLWRTSWDIQDTWESLDTILARQAELHLYSGPDRWNDPDMLEVGNGGLSPAEERTHLGMWAMLAAPLLAGNDVRTMRDETRDLLVSPEIVALDQDPLGRQARRVRGDGASEVWARPLADGSCAVALRNRASTPREIAVEWGELGARDGRRAAVRDLWQRTDVARAAEGIAITVAPHDTVVLRARPTEYVEGNETWHAR